MKCLLWLVLSFFSLHHGGSSLLQLAAVITAGLLLLYIPLCYEDFHFHVAHMYARLGYSSAQHILGQRYLQGNVSSKLTCCRSIYGYKPEAQTWLYTMEYTTALLDFGHHILYLNYYFATLSHIQELEWKKVRTWPCTGSGEVQKSTNPNFCCGKSPIPGENLLWCGRRIKEKEPAVIFGGESL